jgi:drug/metabolite transporter (DMT)-like permease
VFKGYSTPWIIAILISLLGAICFSTKAIFVKLAYRDSSVDTISLLALRMLFSLPFFVSAAIFSSRKESNVKFTGKQWVYVAFIGCLGYYISSYLDFVGLQFVSASIERLILFIYPTFVVIITSFVFREAVTTRQKLAVAVTYLGLALAFVSEASINEAGTGFYFGSACILLCALTFAMYIAGSGRLIPTIGSVKFNSYAMSFACVAVLIHFFIASNHSLFNWPVIVYVYAFAMAVVSTVIPSYLVSISLNRLGSNNTAIIASVGPISTILQASWFLEEEATMFQWLGTVFILAGILMISWKATHTTKPITG